MLSAVSNAVLDGESVIFKAKLIAGPETVGTRSGGRVGQAQKREISGR